MTFKHNSINIWICKYRAGWLRQVTLEKRKVEKIVRVGLRRHGRKLRMVILKHVILNSGIVWNVKEPLRSPLTRQQGQQT